jgi:hypothetical protein
VLPSLVIKIEYCRALHQGSKEPSRPGSLSCVPALEKAPISRCPATKKPSISTFAAAFLTETASHSEIVVTHSKQTTATFLTETRIAPVGLRQGTAFYAELRSAAAPESRVVNRLRQGTPSAVPSLVCSDEKGGIQLNYSVRAASSARPSGCALDSGATNVNFGPFPTGLPGAFFAKNSVSLSPFLTGSASQTELPVTHSKQTTATFLTGARMHIKEFANPHFSAPKNLLLHRRPIQIFLRPTI